MLESSQGQHVSKAQVAPQNQGIFENTSTQGKSIKWWVTKFMRLATTTGAGNLVTATRTTHMPSSMRTAGNVAKCTDKEL